MGDQDIIALYWAREEDAIRETAAKYGGLCRSIVGRILASPEDGEECLNDTYLGLWNAIPPRGPAAGAAGGERLGGLRPHHRGPVPSGHGGEDLCPLPRQRRTMYRGDRRPL